MIEVDETFTLRINKKNNHKSFSFGKGNYPNKVFIKSFEEIIKLLKEEKVKE